MYARVNATEWNPEKVDAGMRLTEAKIVSLSSGSSVSGSMTSHSIPSAARVCAAASAR